MLLNEIHLRVGEGSKSRGGGRRLGDVVPGVMYLHGSGGVPEAPLQVDVRSHLTEVL